MKPTKSVMVVVLMSLLHAFSGPSDERMRMTKPGGDQGFLKATFTGWPYDGTSDIWAKATELETYPTAVYMEKSESFPFGEQKTVGYATYMKMERGTSYDFKAWFDDFATVKIGSQMVIPEGKGCHEQFGSFTPPSTGWYAVELRVSNYRDKGGIGEYHGRIMYGILWKKARDAGWRRFDANEDDLFCTGKKMALVNQNVENDAASNILTKRNQRSSYSNDEVPIVGDKGVLENNNVIDEMQIGDVVVGS